MVSNCIGYFPEYRGVTGTPPGVIGPSWALMEERRQQPRGGARPPSPNRIGLGGGPVGEHSNFKKFPTHTQDHGDGIATRGESVRLRTLIDRSESVDAT